MSPDEYRAAREALGLSQDELAKRLGLSREAINRREKGGRITEEMALALRSIAAERQPRRSGSNNPVRHEGAQPRSCL